MVRHGGSLRWSVGSRLDNSPLLLFLPGIDGIGLGLSKQHNTLGKIFDIWCLHIPVKDRTSFLGLVKLIERTVRSRFTIFLIDLYILLENLLEHVLPWPSQLVTLMLILYLFWLIQQRLLRSHSCSL
ncbi:hypothetical protein OIU76_019915 [Salix suchowensis]|nr:hypothetical protein OIU76_019915 [Salix suchowensis]